VTARLAGLLVAPVVLVPLEELVEPGIELAIELGLTVYDSLYLALALRGGHSLVTADRRIVEAAERAGLQATVRLLG
jgi:predicted nucleic acid-binding protein